ELAGTVIILGPPGGGNLGTQLRVEAGALQRDVAQDRDHVDHKGLPFRPVQGLAPAVVEQTEQITPKVDLPGGPSLGSGALEDPAAHLLVGGQRFGRPPEVTVGLLRAEIEERSEEHTSELQSRFDLV